MKPKPDTVWKLLSLGAARFAAVGAQQLENGVPVQRFKKEVIHAGDFVKASENLRFTVTKSTLKNWAAQFAHMKVNGVAVPIPMDAHVDERGEQAIRNGQADAAQTNAGWVEDMFVEGDSLFIVAKLIGADAILAAARNDVSIFSPPAFIDGNGVSYSRPITHVALVRNPVIPGLGEFIPLAASLAIRSGNVDFLKLLQTLATALGIAEPITDQNAEALIVPAINALIDKAKGAAPAPPPAASQTPAAASSAPAPGADGQREVTLTQKIIASHAPPSPMLVKVLADNRTLKLARLVEKGKITPAVKKRLEEQYIGKDGAAISLALSANPNADGGDFDALIETLEMNEPLGGKKQSFGPQTPLELSDPLKGNGDTPTNNRLTRHMEQYAKAAGQ